MTIAMDQTFAEFLRQWVTHFRTTTALAQAIGMNQSRLTRVLQGDGVLNVLNCLKLAQVTGESPSVVLRLAGKGAEADLIEALYAEGGAPVSRTELERLQQWKALPPEVRMAIDKVVEVVLEKQAKRSVKTGASVRR